VRARELSSPLARLDLGEPANAAFGLRHDLVGHDEDVAAPKLTPGGVGDQCREVVARPDVRQGAERADLEQGRWS
jgi:hypothetical protein